MFVTINTSRLVNFRISNMSQSDEKIRFPNWLMGAMVTRLFARESFQLFKQSDGSGEIGLVHSDSVS
jgi:hypothetical protein